MASSKPGRPLVLALFVIGWLTGCSATVVHDKPLLNSDQILQQYGSYGVAVLKQSDSIRIANLYSDTASGSRICRTYAVTQYQHPLASPLRSAHQKIVAGQSIGETLRTEGWTIGKRGLHLGELDQTTLPDRIYTLMQADRTDLAAYVYELNVSRQNQSYTYATIAEIYHPDYLTLDELSQRHSTELASQPLPPVLHSVIQQDPLN